MEYFQYCMYHKTYIQFLKYWKFWYRYNRKWSDFPRTGMHRLTVLETSDIAKISPRVTQLRQDLWDYVEGLVGGHLEIWHVAKDMVTFKPTKYLEWQGSHFLHILLNLRCSHVIFSIPKFGFGHEHWRLMYLEDCPDAMRSEHNNILKLM